MLEATRERIDTVAKRIDILSEEGNKKLKDAYTLATLQAKLCVEVIIGERLLAGEWRYIHDNHVVRLLAAFDRRGMIRRIRELVKPLLVYDDIKLACADGVTLKVDVDTLTLWLTVETANQFIQENGITLDMTGLIESRNKQVKRLEETNALLSSLGGTQC